MKKFMISVTAIFLIMSSGQVLADTVSRVGKKVGSEATVILNGKQLSDAIIVDGKAYAPVRDIAEAFGAEVEFESAKKDEKAVITLKTFVQSSDGSIIPPEHQIVILEMERKELEQEIANYNKGIKQITEETIPQEQQNLESTESDTHKENSRKAIDAWEKKRDEWQSELDALTARLAEINKQISELESVK